MWFSVKSFYMRSVSIKNCQILGSDTLYWTVWYELPPRAEVVTYFEKTQKNLGIVCCQAWRLKSTAADTLNTAAGSKLFAHFLSQCLQNFLLKNTKHYSSLSTRRNFLNCGRFVIKATLSIITTESRMGQLMQGKEYQDHPYLCKPWITSQLIKALGLAPWPTDTCAKSLFLPTYRGTAPPGQRDKEPHTPV